MKNEWITTSECPGDGDSIWIVVSGLDVHVEYAQTWVEDDFLWVHRLDGEYEGSPGKWPPLDVLFWKRCEMPKVDILCPFCNTPIARESLSCCASMIALRAIVRQVES